MLLLFVFCLGAWLGYYKAQKRLNEVIEENKLLKQQIGQLQAAVQSGHRPEALQQVVGSATQTQRVQEATVPPPKRHIDNVTILLYFGAFMFIAAMSLFVTLAEIGGLARTVLTAMVAGAFYFVGMHLFKNSHRLKPAGLSFISVGMVLVPFIGLAAHVYIFDKQAGPIVWGITSVLAIALYWYAFNATKHVYVTYFLLGSILSLSESGVAIIGMPVYYFGLVMSLVGLIFMLVGRYKIAGEEIKESLSVASSMLIPASLTLSIMNTPQFGFIQTSFAFGLSSLYYWLTSVIGADKKDQKILMTTASLLSAISAGLLTWVITKNLNWLSVVTLVTSIVYVAGLVAIRSHKGETQDNLRFALLAASQVSMLSAIYIQLAAPIYLTIILSIFILVELAAYYATNEESSAFLAGLAWIALPAVLGLYTLDPHMSAGQITLLYLGFAGLAGAARAISVGANSISIGRITYGAGVVCAFIAALSAGKSWAAIISLVLAAALMTIAIYEKAKYLWLIAGGLMFVSLAYVLDLALMDLKYALPLGFGLLAGAQYTLALRLNKYPYIDEWRIAAIVGAGAGAFCVVIFGVTTVPMIINTAVVAGLMYVESNRYNNQAGKYLSGAVAMISSQWFMSFMEVKNPLIYTHLWAILFALYALWANSLKSEKDEWSYTRLSLLALTIPMVMRMFGDQGGLYGWLLIAEQIGLIVLGMSINRHFITKWGLITAVLAILYQLRYLAFIGLAFVGLGVIGLAVYILIRRDKQSSKSFSDSQR